MSFELRWRSDERDLLLLVLRDALHYADFVAVDAAITDRLREVSTPIVLIADVSGAVINPYDIDRIRATQTYLRTTAIAQIMVVDEKKVNRLAMLLLLNLARPKLSFYASLAQALSFTTGHARHSV